jgi:single-strand DNA-binding protein
MPATQITIIGNLTAEPELHFTPSGSPVVTFTVASNERYRDNSGEWQDGPVSFHRVNAWRTLAEHAAESLAKGTRVIVSGTLRQRAYETEPRGDGDTGKRSVWEIRAAEIGAALSYATAKVTKARHDSVPPPEDPYADDNGGYSVEPPF